MRALETAVEATNILNESPKGDAAGSRRAQSGAQFGEIVYHYVVHEITSRFKYFCVPRQNEAVSEALKSQVQVQVRAQTLANNYRAYLLGVNKVGWSHQCVAVAVKVARAPRSGSLPCLNFRGRGCCI